MTSEQFRSWIHTHVETWRPAFPSLPVFYENGERPDRDKLGAHWLDVCVSFKDTDGVTLGPRARARDSGVVKLLLYTKAGEGTQLTDQITESLREYFRTNNRTNEAFLDTPRRHSAPEALGWIQGGVMLPFRCDLA
jgi:hypothetical protein